MCCAVQEQHSQSRGATAHENQQFLFHGESSVGRRAKYLLGFESRRHPGVLLQRAARVVVRGGVPLEFVHQLGDRLLHLYGHGCHCMLLTATLAVGADLPVEGHGTERSVRAGVLL